MAATHKAAIDKAFREALDMPEEHAEGWSKLPDGMAAQLRNRLAGGDIKEAKQVVPRDFKVLT